METKKLKRIVGAAGAVVENFNEINTRAKKLVHEALFGNGRIDLCDKFVTMREIATDTEWPICSVRSKCGTDTLEFSAYMTVDENGKKTPDWDDDCRYHEDAVCVDWVWLLDAIRDILLENMPKDTDDEPREPEKMKREILFKGEHYSCGYPLIGQLSVDDDGVPRIRKKGDSECVPVRKASVSQYTGLDDCDGHRIFEGDRVRVQYKYGYDDGIVVWNPHSLSFCLKTDGDNILMIGLKWAESTVKLLSGLPADN